MGWNVVGADQARSFAVVVMRRLWSALVCGLSRADSMAGAGFGLVGEGMKVESLGLARQVSFGIPSMEARNHNVAAIALTAMVRWRSWMLWVGSCSIFAQAKCSTADNVAQAHCRIAVVADRIVRVRIENVPAVVLVLARSYCSEVPCLMVKLSPVVLRLLG